MPSTRFPIGCAHVAQQTGYCVPDTAPDLGLFDFAQNGG